MYGIELRARRLALGLTQPALADELDVSQPTVSYWEKDKYPIPRGVDLDLHELEAERDQLVEMIREADPEVILIDEWADRSTLPLNTVLVAAVMALPGRTINSHHDMRTTVHPAFLRKAMDALEARGGEGVPAEKLALWAQNARLRGDSRAIALVAEDGEIVGTGVRPPADPWTPGAAYVDDETIKRWGLEREPQEISFACAAIGTKYGQRVTQIPFWEVGTRLDAPINDWK